MILEVPRRQSNSMTNLPNLSRLIIILSFHDVFRGIELILELKILGLKIISRTLIREAPKRLRFNAVLRK